jgi:glycosyltransferase involved in cell wall biosynthesis
MKIIWKGPVMNPTGFSTANREMVKALDRIEDVKVQCSDIYTDEFHEAKGMEKFNKPINAVGASTIFSSYPDRYDESYGQRIGCVMHEGTKLHDQWIPPINTLHKIFVPSKATKNLLRWHNIQKPIKVIPFGINNLYFAKSKTDNTKSDYIFLSVNSWTGELNDRKGTDVLVKAFWDEFKDEPNIKLWLKVSTFWQSRPKDFYAKRVLQILGEQTDRIMINEEYLPEENIAELYRMADCFVSPTKGESFGMTILNARASAIPVVVTKDPNSGHMDFCSGEMGEGVVWIHPSGYEQGDRRFFAEGNMQPRITLEEMRKSLREAYNQREKLSKEALKISQKVCEEWTWDNTAKDIEDYLLEDSKW